jgi:uncharacterized protein YraI
MNLSERGSVAVWGFIVLAILALWGSQVAWATPDQSPAYQTVPTRIKSPTPTNSPVRTNTPVPPTNTPVRPTDTRQSPTNTPIPPRGATAAPSSTPLASSTLSPANTPVSVAMATAKENLRIRVGPSTSAAVMGQLKKGDTVQIVGRSPADDWWQISLPANPNARGWISAEFTLANGPIDSIPVIQGSVVSVITPTPTVLAAPTDNPLPPTSTAPARAEILPQPTSTPSILVTPIDVVEPAESSNPMVSVVIGVVLLGIGGGFVLIILGIVISLLGRS